jgi:tetrahydromethanopterin S-methyltransferase subunit B
MSEEHEACQEIIEAKDQEISDLKEKIAELDEIVDKYYRALDEINDITRKVV